MMFPVFQRYKHLKMKILAEMKYYQEKCKAIKYLWLMYVAYTLPFYLSIFS